MVLLYDCSVCGFLYVDAQYPPEDILFHEYPSVMNVETRADLIINNIYLLMRKSNRLLLLVHLLLKNYEPIVLYPLR